MSEKDLKPWNACPMLLEFHWKIHVPEVEPMADVKGHISPNMQHM
jgi:hypothetical protein